MKIYSGEFHPRSPPAGEKLLEHGKIQ